MSEYTFEYEEGPILVELTPVEMSGKTGFREASSIEEKVDEATEKADQAFNNALTTIRRTAGRVSAMLTTITADPEQRPLSKIELEFGLNLKSDANAFIVKAGVEAQMKVKLTWEASDD